MFLNLDAKVVIMYDVTKGKSLKFKKKFSGNAIVWLRIYSHTRIYMGVRVYTYSLSIALFSPVWLTHPDR